MSSKIYSYEYLAEEASKLCLTLKSPACSVKTCKNALTSFIHLYFETLIKGQNGNELTTKHNKKCNNILTLVFDKFEEMCITKSIRNNNEDIQSLPISAPFDPLSYCDNTLSKKNEWLVHS